MILHFEVDMRGKLQGNGERKVQLNVQADSRDSPAFAETEPAIESAVLSRQGDSQPVDL
jgi:hypothetical protein